MTDYPNREHLNADKAARRRALSGLRGIIEDAENLSRLIEGGYEPHGTDAQRFADKAVSIAVKLQRHGDPPRRPRVARGRPGRGNGDGGPIMNDSDTSQQGGALGTRKIRVRAFGDTADEIELSALDEARRVFGPDVPLAIDRSYLIVPVENTSATAEAAGGKGYTASVDVRERPAP
jgi:hypothetical protein